MFEHFVVQNFRCFSGLCIKQLGRVNLISGKNNTGKTAMFEAIHLHCNPANWQLPIHINKERGIANPSEAMEDVCGWLFYGGHAAGGLKLESHNEKGLTRTFSMYIFDPPSARSRFPKMEEGLASPLSPPLFPRDLPPPIPT